MDQSSVRLKDSLRALPRGAWVLCFGTFLNKFGTFVLPFLAIYLTRLGYTPAQAGLASGAYGIGMLCACLLGGHLADGFGRRKTILLSMFSVAAAMLGLSQARSLPAIVALAALAGLTGELYRPACSALLADLVPPNQRVTAFAAYRACLNAGFAFGPATAGLLAKYSFQWLFVGDAASSVLFGLVAWLALPAASRATRSYSSLRETWKVLSTDRAFRRVLCSSFAVALVFVQVFSAMSVEITRSGFSSATYGLVISLNGALVVLCELPLTTWTRRFPARPVMALGYVLIGLGFASNVLPRTLPLLVLTVALFTFGEMVTMPVSSAYVAGMAPEHQRGLYLGAHGMVWSLAFICGPSCGMWVYALSPRVLWSACGVLGLLAAAIILGAFSPAAQPSQPGSGPTRDHNDPRPQMEVSGQ